MINVGVHHSVSPEQWHFLPLACDCPDGSMCEGYGGQCPCMAAADAFVNITGRQCNLCPFFNYLTPQGCTGTYIDSTAPPPCTCV